MSTRKLPTIEPLETPSTGSGWMTAAIVGVVAMAVGAAGGYVLGDQRGRASNAKQTAEAVATARIAGDDMAKQKQEYEKIIAEKDKLIAEKDERIAHPGRFNPDTGVKEMPELDVKAGWREMKPGQLVRIKNPRDDGPSDVNLFKSANAIEDYADFLKAQDPVGLSQLEKSGRIYRVSSGCRARVIKSVYDLNDVSIYVVRIEDDREVKDKELYLAFGSYLFPRVFAGNDKEVNRQMHDNDQFENRPRDQRDEKNPFRPKPDGPRAVPMPPAVMPD